MLKTSKRKLVFQIFFKLSLKRQFDINTLVYCLLFSLIFAVYVVHNIISILFITNFPHLAITSNFKSKLSKLYSVQFAMSILKLLPKIGCWAYVNKDVVFSCVSDLESVKFFTLWLKLISNLLLNPSALHMCLLTQLTIL